MSLRGVASDGPAAEAPPALLGDASQNPPLITERGRYELAWSLLEGVGPLRYARLLEHFGDAEQAFAASGSQLREVESIGPQTADGIVRQRNAIWSVVEAELSAAAEHGVRIITRSDPDYPPGLRRIPDAPLVLYVRGSLRPTDAVALAVVGSRRCSLYGSEQAQRFGELLAGAGFTVISGLAHGIDALAHHGAVQAGGRSIAILGNGLHDVYPPENRALAEKLVENGALLSELPMRASVRSSNFPSRNRIIAGMALGVLVVEAANRSGALITARLASEYNREVFAIPGRIQDPMSIGANQLIRDGAAKLVMTLEDILDELGTVGDTLRPTPAAERPGAAQPALFPAGGGREPEFRQVAEGDPAVLDSRLTETEVRVLAAVTSEPLLQDAVIRAVGLPAGEVLAAFTSLELKALLRRLPGQMVIRRGKAP